MNESAWTEIENSRDLHDNRYHVQAAYHLIAAIAIALVSIAENIEAFVKHAAEVEANQ